MTSHTYSLQHHKHLSKLFGSITTAQAEQILSASKILHLDSGEHLFKELDKENALYILLTGRLRALKGTEQGQMVIGDIAAGEPVGELALFTKEPRSASVVALRKSSVLQIQESDYYALVQQNPNLANAITKYIINRLQQNSLQKQKNATPKNIAVIKIHQSFDIEPFTDEMLHQFSAMDTSVSIYAHSDHEASGSDALFDLIENNEGINFLVCDNEHPVWAKQCITYCDVALVVADFNDVHAVSELEEKLELYKSDILSKKIYLLLLHPENAPLPRETRRWFEGRNVSLHLHLRKNNALDARRFCRILTNRAVGLVLGGGGAKGFAHFGAVKAMLESGIEFDFLGGTSAGALFGTGLALTDFDVEQATRLGEKGARHKPTSNDYQYPYISLLSGKKARAFFKDIFADIYLEDIWVTTFAISANYSNATLEMHTKGLARRAVEASIAIPGVFPPVIINKHLHVDGGVMDNLPIEPMYTLPVCHVVAVSLSSKSPHLVEIEQVPSAWEIFVNKITKRRKFRLPGMTSLLINSLSLNSAQRQESTKSQIAFYIELDLKQFGFLEWSKWQQLIEKGYEQTKVKLNTLHLHEQFWK